MDTLFQKSLTDVVKGLRVASEGESKYLEQALTDVRREIKSVDPLTKATALQKLVYISMLQGADTGWAAFYCLEVMSLARFPLREIGYLAACSSFQASSDVLLLATNLLKKDLNHSRQYEVGLALNCLANILTPQLARDLTPDITAALTSSKPYIRKRACLALCKLFEQDPEEAPKRALKPLADRLGDADPSVQCAAVNVICELVGRSTQREGFLPLAPQMYRLLTTSDNNWLVIKVVKVFGMLAPLEPRLGPKLRDPLSDILQHTPAKSLLLECIRTAIVALPDDVSIMSLCAEKLQPFLSDPDPNLRYLGLGALRGLLERQPSLGGGGLGKCVFACLEDLDPGVQRTALLLLHAMVTEETLHDTVTALLKQLRHSRDGELREALVATVLELCSWHHYSRVHDFAWYVEVLAELARAGTAQGATLGAQLLDIAMRVEAVRSEAVRVCLTDLLQDPSLLVPPGNKDHPCIHFALTAAAGVVGEYAAWLSPPRRLEAVEALLQPRVALLPPAHQAVYVEALLKVVLHAAAASRGKAPADLALSEAASCPRSGDEMGAICGVVRVHLGRLVNSRDTEVQERACNLQGLLDLLDHPPESSAGGGSDTTWGGALDDIIHSLLSEEMRPVSEDAQSRVAVPEGLELESSLEGVDTAGVAELGVAVWDPVEPDNAGREAGGVESSGGVPGSEGERESKGSVVDVRQKHSQYYLPKDLGQREKEEDVLTSSSKQEAAGAGSEVVVKRRPPRAIVRLDEDAPYTTSFASIPWQGGTGAKREKGPFDIDVAQLLASTQISDSTESEQKPKRKHHSKRHRRREPGSSKSEKKTAEEAPPS